MFISSITSPSFRNSRIVEQSDWGKWSIVEKALNSQNMAIFSNDYEHFQHGAEFKCQVKNIMKVAYQVRSFKNRYSISIPYIGDSSHIEAPIWEKSPIQEIDILYQFINDRSYCKTLKQAQTYKVALQSCENGHFPRE